jgi:hypothetical protein
MNKFDVSWRLNWATVLVVRLSIDGSFSSITFHLAVLGKRMDETTGNFANGYVQAS